MEMIFKKTDFGMIREIKMIKIPDFNRKMIKGINILKIIQINNFLMMISLRQIR